jgi:hypothetical protein
MPKLGRVRDTKLSKKNLLLIGTANTAASTGVLDRTRRCHRRPKKVFVLLKTYTILPFFRKFRRIPRSGRRSEPLQRAAEQAQTSTSKKKSQPIRIRLTKKRFLSARTASGAGSPNRCFFEGAIPPQDKS